MKQNPNSRLQRLKDTKLKPTDMAGLMANVRSAAARIPEDQLLLKPEPEPVPVPVESPPTSAPVASVDDLRVSEHGSFEDNVQELRECRHEKQELTRQLARLSAKGATKEQLELIKVQLSLLADRERSAREAVKLFNSDRAQSLNLPTIRIIIEDWTGEAETIEGSL